MCLTSFADANTLTMNLVHVPVRPALKLIGDIAGVNMVVADTVQGDVTINLRDVHWEHALELVARMRQLIVRRDGNLIWITAVADGALVPALPASHEPMVTLSLALSFGNAVDLARLLGGDGSRRAFLSPRGRALADERSNTLVLTDISQKLAELKPLLAYLDRATRQVLVEARVVVASEHFRRSLGVRWGVRASRGKANVQPRTGNGQYTVNLPASGDASHLGVSILGRHFLAELELSAGQVNGQVRHVASPRVIVGDHAEALIRQGKELAYRPPAAGNEVNVSTQFKRADLALRVTPSIMADGKVQLRIEMTNDSLADLRLTGGVPRIDTHGLTTTVVVGDGETAVIGGVDGSTHAESRASVPWLGNVPWLGTLFRARHRHQAREELLLFIRPSILADTSTTATPSVADRRPAS